VTKIVVLQRIAPPYAFRYTRQVREEGKGKGKKRGGGGNPHVSLNRFPFARGKGGKVSPQISCRCRKAAGKARRKEKKKREKIPCAFPARPGTIAKKRAGAPCPYVTHAPSGRQEKKKKRGERGGREMRPIAERVPRGQKGF